MRTPDTAPLTSGSLLELVRQTDALGVLSIYVDTAPGQQDPGPRGSEIDIKNRLARLRRSIQRQGSPGQSRALENVLDRLSPEIDRLLDPAERGRGRALFAELSSERVTRLACQMPVPNRVVLDSSAFVHPLVELLDEGRAAGVVLASKRGARLLEWRLGDLLPITRIGSDAVQAPHERSGPVGPSPSGQRRTPAREQRESRERDRVQRLVGEVAAAATRLAAEREWERLVVSGGEQMTDALAAALPPKLREVTVRDARTLDRLSPAELAETITETLRAAHDARELRLIREIRETALAAGAAAVGLSEVVAALNEARVAALVYDPNVRYRGRLGEDGRLHAGDMAGPGAGSVVNEPRLTERIVERCLATNARVVPVEGAATGDLAAAGGIAALLRW